MDNNVYRKGKNRIFYQAFDLNGASVECDFLNPKLERSEKMPMIYFGEETYYVDVFFKYGGAYVLRAFKDGVKLNHNIIQVSDSSDLIIYPDDVTMV